LFNLLRLTRPLNLLIIAATMYCLRWCVVLPLLRKYSPGFDLSFSGFHFFLSVLAMILLAAAGNIINDYFDQKVDRINRPHRLIVGKTVKRRVAMMLHHGLNIAAVLISLYLAWVSHLWMAIIIPVFIATLLWWYSPVLKKKAFWGNLAVALCVASVPLWAGMFDIRAIERAYSDMLPALQEQKLLEEVWFWLTAFAVFAFLLTLAREAQKDLEDLEGDRAEGYTTLPIVQGEKNTRIYAASILFIAFVLVAAGTGVYLRDNKITFLFSSLLVAAPILVSMIYTLRAQDKKGYALASRLTKLAMAGGIFFTFVIRWWLMI